MKSPMRQFAPVLVLLVCAAAAQGQEPGLKPPAAAESAGTRGPVDIFADRIEGYANREVSASGDAELRQGRVSVLRWGCLGDP